MTPKEKAKDLVEKFMEHYKNNDSPFSMHSQAQKYHAKQCALICVKEIMAKHFDDWDIHSEYWNKVKQEIQKL